ncbi:MAG: aa3-type cytochrome c oxidase subunit IV [Candidatus Symbiobacter sp.]|nr:aa3-type cytochrome c oxidase subunit IV [Candidatus Symbiobacter sp.]
MTESHDYQRHQQSYDAFTRAIGIGIIGTAILLVFMAIFLV